MQAALRIDRPTAAAGDVAASVGEPQAEDVDEIVGSVDVRADRWTPRKRETDGEDAIKGVAVYRQIAGARTDDRHGSGDGDRP